MSVRKSSRQRRPVAVDLFCGAGGFALGLEQAGFDVVAGVDYDPIHMAVHAFNFPLAKSLCGDLAKIPSEEIWEAAAEGWTKHRGERGGEFTGIDVIVGGPPCQGFSTIGKRLVDDERNQLVFHFLRIVRDLRPRYFVMENVPGMAFGGHSGILARLVEEFEGAGYRITKPPRTLNAADYGVPQDRERVFLLGGRRGQRPLRYPESTARPVPKRGQGELPLELDGSPPLGPSVRDALGDLPDLDQFEVLLRSDEVRLTEEELQLSESRASGYARRMRGLEKDPNDYGHPRIWDKNLLTSSHRTVHTQRSIDRFSETRVGEVEPISRFYRLDADGLSNTLRAGTSSERGAYTSPRPIHPIQPRVISVREAARLHSFPDWFRFHRTKWHGFRQVGNAVPPLLGRAVAREVAAALELRPYRGRGRVPLGDPALLSLSMREAAETFDADRRAIPRPRRRSAAR